MWKPRFALLQLFIWVLVFAFDLAILDILPCSVEAISASGTALAALLVGDLFHGGGRSVHHPTLSVARYTFALAVSIAVAFLVLLFCPPDGGAGSTADSIAEWATDSANAIGWAIAAVFSYFLVVGFLSVVSFGTAVFQWRRHREAKWLTLLNIPGLCLFVYCLAIMAIEGMSL